MLLDEIDKSCVKNMDIPDIAIRLKNANFSFDNRVAFMKDLNIDFKRGELVAVLGEVGSGKSSLLLGMLGEMYQLNEGLVNVNGSLTYVSQQAWIQNCTIKENILFGKEFDMKLYNKVLEMTSLVPDIEQMPAGIYLLFQYRFLIIMTHKYVSFFL